MQGGSDNSWSRPFNPNPTSGEAFGTHRGHMKALNVRGLRPGFHVAYAHRDPKYAGFTQSMLMQGYRPVQPESGTRCGADLPAGFGSPQDSTVGFNKLMLMEIPIEQYKQIQAEKAAFRAQASDGPTRAFLDRNGEFQAAYGPSGARLNAVYADPRHGRNGYEIKETE